MLSFKTFITEKVYQLDSKENKQVEDILQTYERLFDSGVIGNKDPQKFYKKNLTEDGIFIGSIKFFDNALKQNREVPVYVSFEGVPADAAFSDEDNTIELFYHQFDDLTTIVKRNKIAHELFHAKQHYKKITSGYRKSIQKRTLPSGNVAIRSERGYYFAPGEYPVQVASIVHEMDRQYRLILKHIKSGNGRQFWEKQRQGFLRLLDMFIRSPRVITGNDLPSYLKDQERFIRALYRNKNDAKYSKYYKDFKRKLYWFYQNLSKAKKDNGEEAGIDL
jgi:hypothetical protein